MGLGINLSTSGGIFRTSNNMYNIQQELNKSLQRIETGNKISSAAEDPVVYARGIDLESEINQLEGSIANNKASKEGLDKVAAAQTGILENLQAMKDLMEDYALDDDGVAGASDAQAALAAQFADYVASNTQLTASGGMDADQDFTINYGFEDSRDLTVSTLDLSGIDASGLDGTAGSATTVVGQIDTEIAKVMAASATVGAAIEGGIVVGNNTMSAHLSAKSDLYQSVMGVNEAEESAKVTALQMRQQAATSSVSIQNTFAASTMNLLG